MKKSPLLLLSLVIFLWNPTSVTQVSAASLDDQLAEDYELDEDDIHDIDECESTIQGIEQNYLVILEPEVEEEHFTESEFGLGMEEETTSSNDLGGQEELTEETVAEEPSTPSDT